MENKFKNIKIEYHILQSFPVTCLNRDDVGSPKTAVIGGVKRARVSSQCWKRQVRVALHDAGVPIAVRTKRIADLILDHLDSGNNKYVEAAETVASAISDDTLVFFSNSEAELLAKYIIENEIKKDDKKLADKLHKYLKEEIKANRGIDGMDVALFGRMIAKAPSMNIEAASSFSHAITTHRVSSEVDFFTAVDDRLTEEETGSAHMGALEFMSGTFYRYVSLNLGVLYENLGDEDAALKAAEEFTKALYIAVPSARQKTQAGYCLWDFAHVFVRKGQEIQLAFDSPVKSEGNGYLAPSIKMMEDNLTRNKKLMGEMFGEIGEYIFGDSSDHGIDGLIGFINKTLEEIK